MSYALWGLIFVVGSGLAITLFMLAALRITVDIEEDDGNQDTE